VHFIMIFSREGANNTKVSTRHSILWDEKHINISTNTVKILYLSRINNCKNKSRSFMTKDIRIFCYLYSHETQ